VGDLRATEICDGRVVGYDYSIPLGHAGQRNQDKESKGKRQ
jgi:hypothetical protein